MMHKIEQDIRDWLERPGNNSLGSEDGRRAFDAPLVGCARGDDEIFTRIKEDIGDFHWTPAEIFTATYPEVRFEPRHLAVIAWILPQTAATRRAHRARNDMPSEEWSRARHYGERVNEGLRQYVAAMLSLSDHPAVAPALSPFWERRLSPRHGYASRWSERHAAHACGLGTFGLSDGLITPVGKSVRIGSVVALLDVEPARRPYEVHTAWCLFHALGKCSACIRRCPAGAISEKGHDKERCKAYIRGVTAPYVEREQLGFRVNSCGLCQTGVPCESGIPARLRPDRSATGVSASCESEATSKKIAAGTTEKTPIC